MSNFTSLIPDSGVILKKVGPIQMWNVPAGREGIQNLKHFNQQLIARRKQIMKMGFFEEEE